MNFRAAYALSFTTLEYLFLASFLYLSIVNKKVKQLITTLSAAFIIFLVFFYFNVTLSRFRLDTIPIGLETILLFVYIFIFFYDTLKTNKQIDIYTHYGFWIAIGILLYLGVSFFIYILANDMLEHEIEQFWFVTYIAEIIKNIMFCVAIVMYIPKNGKSKNRLQKNSDSIPHLI